jgi:hypothetical protein
MELRGRVDGIRSLSYVPNQFPWQDPREIAAYDLYQFALFQFGAIKEADGRAGIGGFAQAEISTERSPTIRFKAQAPLTVRGKDPINYRLGHADIAAGLSFWQSPQFPMISGPFGSAEVPAILKLTIKGSISPGVGEPWKHTGSDGRSWLWGNMSSGWGSRAFERNLLPGAGPVEMKFNEVQIITNYVSREDPRLRFFSQIGWAGNSTASIDVEARLEVILPPGFRVEAPFEGFNAPPEPRASIVVEPPVLGETNRTIIIRQPSRCAEYYVLEEADLTAPALRFFPKTPVILSDCFFTPVTIRTEPSSQKATEAKAFRLRKLEGGSDDASGPEYLAGWKNGTNGGSGFGPWVLTNTAGNLGGFVIQDSSTNGVAPSGAINSAGLKSWGIRAGWGASTIASRPLHWPLVEGQTLGWELDTGTILPERRVGVALVTGGTNRWEFSAAAGSSTYRIHDGSSTNANTAWPLTDGGLRCEFTALATNAYALKVVGPTWTNSYSGVLAGEGLIDEIRFFSHGGGNTEAATVFFNHLRITP